MNYDFSKLTKRRNTNSMKWDVKEHELPMWVADMDFETAPCVKTAIEDKAALGIYGYTLVSDDYFASIQDWWKRRHHFTIPKEWMMFSTGVVPALSSIVRKMTTVGEQILIQAPVYNIFYNSILNNGRTVISSNLVYDGKEYHIDFEDLEQKLSNPQTTMMILCNPHNPIGKIWDKQTLAKIGALCHQYHVLVVSDEIHCDICAPDVEYVPFASVNDECKNNSITCISASKAFNLAGLQCACVVVPDPFLRHKVNRGLNTDEVAEPNVFAIEANVAAFCYGEEWLTQLCAYIEENKRYVMNYCKTSLKDLRILPSQATYLAWIDCKALCVDGDALCDFIQEHTGLILSKGSSYGANSKSFLRMNLACPKQRVEDGMARLHKAIDLWKQRNHQVL